LNSIVDRLAVFAASSTQQLLPCWHDCAFQSLHRPYIYENEELWKAIPNDESICVVIQNEPLKPRDIISIENNNILEGLNPLESLFSLSVVGNKEKQKEGELWKKVIETILLNIRKFEPSTNVKIKVQCSGKEEMSSTRLLGESQKVFSWSYEDLRGFDPGLIQYIIKIARQKQEFVNSAPEAPFRRDLRDFLRNGMFFSPHPEWVSILKSAPGTTGNIITCTSLRTFRKVIMRNPSSTLNIEMFLQ
jgi:hypothetical protein